MTFPLRPEQDDISPAVMDMSTEVMRMESTVVPPRKHTDLYIESRYFFEKRIMLVSKENDFMEKVNIFSHSYNQKVEKT